MPLAAIAAAVMLAAPPDLHVRPAAWSLPEFSLKTGEALSERSTQLTLLGTLLVLGVVELAIMLDRNEGRVQPTISQVMQEWGMKFGSVEWFAGNMMGHWFLPTDHSLTPCETRWRAMLLVQLTLVVIAWDVLDHSGRDHNRPGELLIAGIVSGATLWPQGRR